MFMGMAQVLEFGLKSLLVRLFKYDPDRIQKWTLGRVIRELENNGLRTDFIAVLRELLQYRNYGAHEYLANEAIVRRILSRDIGRFERKYLERGIFAVEQAMVIYDWLEGHNGWVVTRDHAHTVPKPAEH